MRWAARSWNGRRASAGGGVGGAAIGSGGAATGSGGAPGGSGGRGTCPLRGRGACRGCKAGLAALGVTVRVSVTKRRSTGLKTFCNGMT